MNKKIAVIIGSVAGICVIGGGIGFAASQGSKSTVKVYNVSDLSQGYWGEPMSLNGMISSDVSQDVHLTDKQVVEEVYVKEGDQVDIGDPLLTYDMTLVNIELEVEKLNKEGMEIQKKGVENDLEKLKKQKPVESGGKSAGGEKQVPKSPGKTAGGNKASKLSAGDQALGGGTPQEASGFTKLSGTKDIPGEDPEDGSKPEDPPDPDNTDKEETPNPVPAVNALEKLEGETGYYKGTGTKEDPYVFLCKENPILMGAFLNMLGGFGDGDSKTMPEKFCLLELRQDDKADGLLLAAILIDGRKIVEKCDPKEEYQIRLGSAKPDPGQEENPGGDPGGDDNFFDIGDEIPEGDIIAGYTKDELEKAMTEKKKDLKKLELDLKESALKIKKTESKLQNQTINSTIKGTVKSVGDPEKGEIDNKPFIQVVSSEGLYVTGTISELLLDKVAVGQKLTGSSMETGTPFEAEIKEISPYPSTNNNFGGGGNNNVSYYPFTAFIAQAEGLKNQEYVSLQTEVQSQGDTSTLYLQKPFVREENGKNYVYRSVKGKLKKQEVVTGKTMYGSIVEIKSGITMEDQLAFPYGKTVKENAKTKEASIEELYQ